MFFVFFFFSAEKTVSFMGLSKRSSTVVNHLSNLSQLPRLEMLPPFGAGSKAGASGIWAADVPAIKRSFQLLEGLSLVSKAKQGCRKSTAVVG